MFRWLEGDEQFDVDADEWSAFEAHAVRSTSRWAGGVCLLCAGATVILWPFDYIFENTAVEIFELARFRLLIVGTLLVSFAASRLTAFGKRRPIELWTLTACVSFFIIGWCVSAIGDLESRYFGMLYFSSIVTVLSLQPPWHRVASAFAVSTATLGGYLIRSPEYLQSPALPPTVTQLMFITVFSISLGHIVYRLNLVAFVQNLRLESLNDDLELRVAEKTRDLRALLERISTSTEAENTELARELHDELGQELTAVAFTLAFTRRKAMSTDAAPVVLRAIDELDILLARTRTSMRRILGRLRPVVVEELGWKGAATWLLEDFEHRTGVTTVAETELDLPDLPPPYSDGLFRILQEGLTNVARHAQASQVRVSLRQEDDSIVLEFADNGHGLAPTADGSGLGMIGMRERAAHLGGRVDWLEPDGGGVLVRVKLPREVQPEST